MDFVDFVDHIAEEIAVGHPVEGAMKNFGNNVAAVAISAAEQTQIGEETVAALAVRPNCFVLIDEGN